MVLVKSAYPGLLVSTDTGLYSVEPSDQPPKTESVKRVPSDPSELGFVFNVWSGTYRYDPDAAASFRSRPVDAQPSPAFNPRGLDYNPYTGTWSVKAPTAETRSDALDFEVPRSDVDPDVLEHVERTVRMASRSLGLDRPPRVRWLPSGTKGCRGVVFDGYLGEIWVVEQPRDAACNSALHEVRHCFQLGSDRYLALGLLTMEQRQEDAERFARTWQPSSEVKAAGGQMLAHKTAPVRVQDVKASRTGWEISGYASVFGDPPDSFGDVVEQGAFTRTIRSRGTKFLFEHQTPIGAQLELKEDATGLFGRWSVVDTQAGTDARKLAMAGVCASLSIGYVPVATEQRSDGARVLKDVDLYEVSLVALPAQPRAAVTDVKRHGS